MIVALERLILRIRINADLAIWLAIYFLLCALAGFVQGGGMLGALP